MNWNPSRVLPSLALVLTCASQAIYGMRGANGVIVIKTKGSH